jgi:hypothetical protein
MSIPVLLAALFALLFIPPDVHAHGYLKSPKSRNWVAREEQQEFCPHCLNKKDWLGTCGKTDTRNYDQDLGPRIQATYNCGQQIDFEVILTAHHLGHFTLKACPISSGQATQACFDANRLRFISGHGANFDPNYPDRAYLPPWQGSNIGEFKYIYRFQLPPGLSGDRVLLQWHYITANSCLPQGYDRYNFPSGWRPANLGACQSLSNDGSGFPEQFWNCAEVRITNNCSGGPAPTPPTTTTGSCPAVTGQCGSAMTCASIGFPGQCCSQYGWCGTSAAHCGTCCQNGPCTSAPTPPAPTPPTTTTGSCPAVTGQCGSARTCASIGFPGQCCSQYGWCGASAAHCGTCCQNGPCTSAPTPPAPTPPTTTTGTLGDWAQCSRNSQCRNGCCSGMYSGGVFKCTPLSGGGFNPSICTAV